MMRLAVCRQCRVSVHQLTVACSSRIRAGRWGGGVNVTSTDVCLARSVEKSLHSVGGLVQAYNTGQVTAAIRLHSRSRPVHATSYWGKGAVLQLSINGLIKKLWFYSLGGADVAIMIAIRSWHDVTIIDHSDDPTSTALWVVNGIDFRPV